jgi:hypothetical protein
METIERNSSSNDANQAHRQRTPARKVTQRRGRRRVQLDLLPEVFERASRLQRKNGLDSMQSVFRESFRLYEWYNTRRSEGWAIQLAHPDGRVMMVDLGLDGEHTPQAAVSFQLDPALT